MSNCECCANFTHLQGTGYLGQSTGCRVQGIRYWILGTEYRVLLGNEHNIENMNRESTVAWIVCLVNFTSYAHGNSMFLKRSPMSGRDDQSPDKEQLFMIFCISSLSFLCLLSLYFLFSSYFVIIMYQICCEVTCYHVSNCQCNNIFF